MNWFNLRAAMEINLFQQKLEKLTQTLNFKVPAQIYVPWTLNKAFTNIGRKFIQIYSNLSIINYKYP